MTNDELITALIEIARSNRPGYDAQAAISKMIDNYAKSLSETRRTDGQPELSDLARKIRDKAQWEPSDGTIRSRLNYAITVLWEHGASW